MNNQTNNPSHPQSNPRDAKPNRPTESATTKALDWAEARARGHRLPEHRLPGEKP